MKPTSYRKNVAAVVANSAGLILACERSDRTGAWQLPQGGIENGESPEEALFRELEEEIGTSDVTIIDRLNEVIRYDWPKKLYKKGYLGQEQHYFLVNLKEEGLLNLEDSVEFQSTKWMKPQEFIKVVEGFKAEAYETAINLFIKNNSFLSK